MGSTDNQSNPKTDTTEPEESTAVDSSSVATVEGERVQNSESTTEDCRDK